MLLPELVITHIVALAYSKRTHVDISVAEELVHGPILIKLFISIAAESKNRALLHKSMKLSTQIVLLVTFIF